VRRNVRDRLFELLPGDGGLIDERSLTHPMLRSDRYQINPPALDQLHEGRAQIDGVKRVERQFAAHIARGYQDGQIGARKW
jgi:hypothetical protein